MAELSVSVLPHGWEFDVKGGESVLDAALRHGFPIRYGCRHGNCSSCKYLVTDGDIDFGAASPYSLPEGERAEGYALLCCAEPLTDLDIFDDAEIDDRQMEILPIHEATATVAHVAQLSPDLWSLELQLEDPLRFYAGQFVELEASERSGEWRSYSMCSSPTDSSRLSFVVKRIEGGCFSGCIDELQNGAPMRVRGPFGTSYLREGDRPVVLVCTGSGIAPILSILRGAAAAGDQRSFTLHYGARTRSDLVMLDALERLAGQLDLDVVTSLSQPTPDCNWPHEGERVTRAVQRGIADASELDVYLCGKPEMCDSLGLLFEAKGARSSRIIHDRFFAAT